MAIWVRKDEPLNGLVSHSDGIAIHVYPLHRTARRTGAKPSVGSVGDSNDNAPAESVNGLYKTKLIHRKGPWRTADDVELATFEWVDWYNNRRITASAGACRSADSEAHFYLQDEADMVAEA